MQSRSFFHIQMLLKSPLRKEIRRQLDRAAKPGTHTGSANASVQSEDTFVSVDLTHPVQKMLVSMLCSHRGGRREALQSCLDQKERTSCSGTEDTRTRSRKYIYTERLNLRVAINHRCHIGSYRLVESQSTPVEDHLIYICRTQSSVYALNSLVADND